MAYYALIPHNRANYAHCLIPIMLSIYICHSYTCVHMFVCTCVWVECTLRLTVCWPLWPVCIQYKCCIFLNCTLCLHQYDEMCVHVFIIILLSLYHSSYSVTSLIYWHADSSRLFNVMYNCV